MGNARYKITKRGIEKVKNEAVNLRKYADNVLDTMNTYKSVWPALARENMKTGETVWLKWIKAHYTPEKKKNLPMRKF